MDDKEKFGVVKPADKNEKIEKSPRPARTKVKVVQTGDNQLRTELAKTDGLENEVVEAGLVKPKREKKVKAPKEKKESSPIVQRLENYADAIKKRHAFLPATLITQVKECASRGAAKRLLRDYLRSHTQ